MLHTFQSATIGQQWDVGAVAKQWTSSNIPRVSVGVWREAPRIHRNSSCLHTWNSFLEDGVMSWARVRRIRRWRSIVWSFPASMRNQGFNLTVFVGYKLSVAISLCGTVRACCDTWETLYMAAWKKAWISPKWYQICTLGLHFMIHDSWWYALVYFRPLNAERQVYFLNFFPSLRHEDMNCCLRTWSAMAFNWHSVGTIKCYHGCSVVVF